MTDINEDELPKMAKRKLRMLENSLTPELGRQAFVTWWEQVGSKKLAPKDDPNAQMIVDALTPLLDKGLKIPKVGYIVKRGRGRVIVQAVGSDEADDE